MSKFLDDFTLHQASIYELRDIARDLKIVPSTHRKEILIEMIKKVLSGETKPEMPKSRQGRPPKKKIQPSFTEIENFSSNSISPNDVFSDSLSEDDEKYDFSPVKEVRQNMLASPSFVYGDDGKIEKLGYFNIVNNKYYFLFEPGRVSGIDNIVSVYENYVKNYDLRPGDLVKFTTKKLSNIDGFALTEVKSINNSVINNLQTTRQNFNEIPIDLSPARKAFSSTNNEILSQINLGDRNVVLTKNLSEFMKLLTEVQNNLENENLINLSLDTLPEDAQNFNNKNGIENFYTIIGDSAKQNKLATILALERAKRLAELGRDVIIVVNEIKKIVKYQNFLLGNLAEDVKNGSLELCYQLLGSARRFNKGSITIISLLKVKSNGLAESPFNDVLISELENMNCKFLKLLD